VRTAWESEIVVIGGGPSGSTVGRRLACLGHEVRLIERQRFPRLHVGESLNPAILPLLDTLGVRDRIENARFLRPQRAIVRWGGETTYVTWPSGEPGFQVDRGAFDLLLLEMALEAGVKVSQPVQALRPVRDGEAGWIIPFKQAGRLGYGKARFLVDASGKQSVLSPKRKRTSPPTIALYGYWRETNLEGVETRIEACRENWFWGAPLPDGLLNATVFLDPTLFTIPKWNSLESFYRGLLSDSILLRECLNGKLASEVAACNASSSHDPAPIGESFIKVGEASFAIDPLSSQGVHSAMLSALQASIVCHTILTSASRKHAAIEFYRTRQIETVDRHQQFAARHYGEHQSFSEQEFWVRRAPTADASLPRVPRALSIHAPDAGCPIQVSKDVAIVEIAVIDGNTIELRPAVNHPGLERPVAFLNNIQVAPLLASIVSGQTLEYTLANWSCTVSRATGLQLLHWMWSRQIIVPVNSSAYTTEHLRHGQREAPS
jgi:flavin-dependent dehydrogenase